MHMELTVEAHHVDLGLHRPLYCWQLQEPPILPCNSESGTEELAITSFSRACSSIGLPCLCNLSGLHALGQCGRGTTAACHHCRPLTDAWAPVATCYLPWHQAHSGAGCRKLKANKGALWHSSRLLYRCPTASNLDGHLHIAEALGSPGLQPSGTVERGCPYTAWFILLVGTPNSSFPRCFLEWNWD